MANEARWLGVTVPGGERLTVHTIVALKPTGFQRIGRVMDDLPFPRSSYFHQRGTPATVNAVGSNEARSTPRPDPLTVKTWRDEPISLRKSQPIRRWRVALYSHDTMGLGHFRRNQLIAQAIVGSALPVNALLVAGIREAGGFATPPGVDLLTLPALHKTPDGRYEPRHLTMPLDEIVNLRAKTISAALTAFEPDVFIVDNVPRGAVRELDLTLHCLAQAGRARIVLGLRDLLDSPEAVRRDWERAENESAIRRYFDAIWVYGDAAVYDLAREYHFAPDIASKIRYCGYLDQAERYAVPGSTVHSVLDRLDLPPGPVVLCLVGGGQDGGRLADAFVRVAFPANTNGIIVTGPFFPLEARQQLQAIAGENRRLRVLDFVEDPRELLATSKWVVAMGGYNTIGEILSYQKRALIVPRVRPRLEQWLRAERLRELGLVDVLHPDDLSPEALGSWIAHEVCADLPPPAVRESIDLNGLARLPGLLQELLPMSQASRAVGT